MHVRLAHAALAFAGLLLVLCFVLFWRDGLRVGAPGPRWRRRLVAAGLGLLCALGLGLPLSSWAADSAGAQQEAGLEASPQWKRVQELVKEAEEIASGRRGDHPFSEAQKKQLWERFGAAPGDVHALVATGALERAEGELLLQWLSTAQERIARFRTTELRTATCYKPMPLPDAARLAEAAAERLKSRMPLVRELAQAKTLHPRVLSKVLQLLAADRDALSRAPKLTAEQRTTLDELGAIVGQLEKKL